MKYLDLTHTIKENMPVYPGDPSPEIKQVGFMEKDGFNDTQIKLGTHTGTHIDAPFHMIKNGKRLTEYEPGRFFGPGHLIDARGKAISADLLDGKKISQGDIVLIITDFSDKFGAPEYYESFPEISPDFALRIVEFGVSLIGLDFPSPDRPPFNVHKILLGGDVLIIENLVNLAPLLGHKKFTVAALPAKFSAEAAPARVIAIIK